MSTIPNIFSLPAVQNPDVQRRAAFLFKIIWGTTTIIIVTFLIAIYRQEQYTQRYLSIIYLTSLTSITLLVLLKKGQVQLSAYGYVTFLLSMIIGFSWTGGGIKGHGIVLLPVVVLFSGLTIGRKQIWLFGIIASLGGLLLALSAYFNILPVAEPLGDSPLIYWTYSNTAIFLLCYIENISVGGLNTSLNETKEELRLRKQSEEKYRLIFESFQDIYYQTDMDGKINIITPSVKARMGYDQREVLGRNVSEFYRNPEDRNKFLSELKVKGSIQNYELDVLAKNGTEINVIASSHILYDNEGNAKGIEGTLHDITQRKKAEDLLKLQNEKLYEIAFLQSHIVRRPIASVLGLLNLINKDNPADPLNFQVVPRLEIAAKELDEVVHQIVQKTSEIKPQSSASQ